MKGILHLLAIVLILSVVSACHEDPGTFTLPSDLDKDYGLVFMDTTTVVTSTVLLDSIPTSSVGPLMFGRYTDPKLGVVDARSYFQVAPPLGGTAWTIADKGATYESAYLILAPSGYYYGDTTKEQTIEVRQIMQDFRTYNLNAFWLNEHLYSYFSAFPDKLYNTSKIKVDTLLGTTTFKPHNVINDSLMVRLNDNLGTRWFQMAKDNSTTITTPSFFVDFFKGLSIRTVNESNIIAFAPSVKNTTNNTTSSTKIRIYYRESVGGLLTEKHYDFPFFAGFYNATSSYNPQNNYTRLDSVDRSGTLIENLTSKNPEISSALTNEETYVEAGVGVATKIRIPSLRNILNIPGYLKINSAKLILEPIKGSYDDRYSLPASLTLFYGKGNLPIQQVYGDFSSRLYQTATIGINYETSKTTGYQFSVTQLIQSLLSGKTDDMKDFSLIVTLPPTEMESKVNRVVLGGGSRSDYRARLEIYYLKQNQ